MDVDELSEKEKVVMWYTLRELFTDMLKGETDEENDVAGYVGRAMADGIVNK